MRRRLIKLLFSDILAGPKAPLGGPMTRKGHLQKRIVNTMHCGCCWVSCHVCIAVLMGGVFYASVL